MARYIKLYVWIFQFLFLDLLWIDRQEVDAESTIPINTIPSLLTSQSSLLNEVTEVVTRQFDISWQYKDVEFWLFKSDFPFVPEIISMDQNFQFDFSKSKLDPKASNKIIIHGFSSVFTAFDRIFKNMVKEYIIRYGNNVNIIFVFWENKLIYPSYVFPFSRVPYLGKLVAKFINEAKLENHIHIIGHSLGAHIAGIASRNVFRRINRITGLDPAGPGFDALQIYPWLRLRKGDADFIDVIHSNAGSLAETHLGIKIPIGDVDFYPTGGRFQPKCDDYIPIFDQICSHYGGNFYFMLSINRRRFPARPCLNPNHVKQVRRRRIVPTVMGEDANPRAEGDYCVTIISRDTIKTKDVKDFVPKLNYLPNLSLFRE